MVNAGAHNFVTEHQNKLLLIILIPQCHRYLKVSECYIAFRLINYIISRITVDCDYNCCSSKHNSSSSTITGVILLSLQTFKSSKPLKAVRRTQITAIIFTFPPGHHLSRTLLKNRMRLDDLRATSAPPSDVPLPTSIHILLISSLYFISF